MTIFERVKALSLPKGEYAVFGSGLLEAWELRKAKDLDIVLTKDLYLQKKAAGWEERQGDGFRYLVHENFPGVEFGSDLNQTSLPGARTKEEMIRGAILLEGVSFVRPSDVIAIKKIYDRPKDHRDILLLEKYLENHSESAA